MFHNPQAVNNQNPYINNAFNTQAQGFSAPQPQAMPFNGQPSFPHNIEPSHPLYQYTVPMGSAIIDRIAQTFPGTGEGLASVLLATPNAVGLIINLAIDYMDYLYRGNSMDVNVSFNTVVSEMALHTVIWLFNKNADLRPYITQDMYNMCIITFNKIEQQIKPAIMQWMGQVQQPIQQPHQFVGNFAQQAIQQQRAFNAGNRFGGTPIPQHAMNGFGNRQNQFMQQRQQFQNHPNQMAMSNQGLSQFFNKQQQAIEPGMGRVNTPARYVPPAKQFNNVNANVSPMQQSQQVAQQPDINIGASIGQLARNHRNAQWNGTVQPGTNTAGSDAIEYLRNKQKAQEQLSALLIASREGKDVNSNNDLSNHPIFGKKHQQEQKPFKRTYEPRTHELDKAVDENGYPIIPNGWLAHIPRDSEGFLIKKNGERAEPQYVDMLLRGEESARRCHYEMLEASRQEVIEYEKTLTEDEKFSLVSPKQMIDASTFDKMYREVPKGKSFDEFVEDLRDEEIKQKASKSKSFLVTLSTGVDKWVGANEIEKLEKEHGVAVTKENYLSLIPAEKPPYPGAVRNGNMEWVITEEMYHKLPKLKKGKFRYPCGRLSIDVGFYIMSDEGIVTGYYATDPKKLTGRLKEMYKDKLMNYEQHDTEKFFIPVGRVKNISVSTDRTVKVIGALQAKVKTEEVLKSLEDEAGIMTGSADIQFGKTIDLGVIKNVNSEPEYVNLALTTAMEKLSGDDIEVDLDKSNLSFTLLSMSDWGVDGEAGEKLQAISKATTWKEVLDGLENLAEDEDFEISCLTRINLLATKWINNLLVTRYSIPSHELSITSFLEDIYELGEVLEDEYGIEDFGDQAKRLARTVLHGFSKKDKAFQEYFDDNEEMLESDITCLGNVKDVTILNIMSSEIDIKGSVDGKLTITEDSFPNFYHALDKKFMTLSPRVSEVIYVTRDGHVMKVSEGVVENTYDLVSQDYSYVV